MSNKKLSSSRRKHFNPVLYSTALEGALRAQAQLDSVQKLVVGAVVFNGDMALVLRRVSNDEYDGFYELPSGAVEQSETLLAALYRELAEETQLKATQLPLYLGHFNYLSSSSKSARQFNFLIHIAHARVSLNPKEHSQCRWVTPSSLASPQFQISPEVVQVVRTAALIRESNPIERNFTKN